MVQMLTVGALFAVGGALLASRPGWLLIAVLWTKIVIPPKAVTIVMGSAATTGGLAHPANFLLLAGFLVLVGRRGSVMRAIARRHVGLASAFTLFLALGGVVTISLAGIQLTLSFLVNFGLPFLVCLLVIGAFSSKAISKEAFAKSLIFLAVLQSGLIAAQVVTSRDLVWFATRVNGARANGTFDSPIEAGAIIASIICLAPFVHRGWVRLLAVAAMTVGVLLTQARGPALVAIVALVYVVFASGARLSAKVTGALGILFVALLTVAIFGQALVARFDWNSDDSFQGHNAALQYVQEHWTEYVILGGGYRVGSAVQGAALATSLENSYFIMVFDFGLIATLIFVAIQVYAAASSIRNGRASMPFAAAMLVLTICALGTSGFIVPTGWSYLLWATAGAAIAHQSRFIAGMDLGVLEPSFRQPTRMARRARVYRRNPPMVPRNNDEVLRTLR